MEVIKEEELTIHLDDGLVAYVTDGPNLNGRPTVFGIMKDHIARIIGQKRGVRIAQLFRIVLPGLVTAHHVFKGLKRPLQYDQDRNGDSEKLVFSWKPPHDYDWPSARRFDGKNGIAVKPPPVDAVFVVVATPNDKSNGFAGIDYWIEDAWTWVDESPILPGAPMDHETRYETKVQ